MARVSCSTTNCAMGCSHSCIAALHSWVTVTHRGFVRFVTSTKPLFQAMLQTAFMSKFSFILAKAGLPASRLHSAKICFILPKHADSAYLFPFCSFGLILLKILPADFTTAYPLGVHA